MSARLRYIAVQLLVAALLVGGCSSKTGVDKPDKKKGVREKTTATAEERRVEGEDQKGGLEFELSESEAAPKEPPKSRRIEGEALSDAERRELLARLPAIAGERDDRKPFSFPAESKPAPKTGETIEKAFPPPEDREIPSGVQYEPKGPLHIVRRAPEGEVEVAPRLSVTFSHPMVPVGETQRPGALDRPVVLEPEVDGKWRWVGSQTLLFEPEGGRFPMASTFEVYVRSKAESLDGSTPSKTLSWTFQTPPVQVEQIHPTGGPQPRDPLMFMAFNQRISRPEIIDHIKVWGGGDVYEPKLAAHSRIENNDVVNRLTEQYPDDQWIVFYVPKRLPAATKFQIGLEQGAPSAEGDRTTEEGQYETFETFGELKLEKTRCGAAECWPGSVWSFEFNNPLDPESIDESRVSVDPMLPDKEIEVYHDTLVIRGQSRGRRTYRVTIDGEVADRFGQTLGSDLTHEFDILPAPPQVYGGGMPRTTLDPTGPPALQAHSINFRELKVRAYRVEPADWPDYQKALREEDVDFPGKLAFEKKIEVEADKEEYASTSIDLSSVLDDGFGHVIVDVRGAGAKYPSNVDRPPGGRRFATWVQSSDIGLDAFIDGDEIVAWTTSLEDGEPVAGVEVSLVSGGGQAKTNDDGVATVPLPTSVTGTWSEVGNLLVATKGKETTFLPEHGSSYSTDSHWVRAAKERQARWFVFDDRNLYRPGERSSLKGWLRSTTDEGLVIPPSETEVDYRIVGPRGNEFSAGVVETDEYGGFDVEFAIPSDINLGAAHVTFETTVSEKKVSYQHRFEVQEFRTPPFEVSVETDSPGPHVVGDTVRATATASYYTGGAVRGSDVFWRLAAQPTNYSPPGWSGFIFGKWNPFWFPVPRGGYRTESLQGRTDESGEHAIRVDLESVEPPEPQQLSVESVVTDVNRQTISGDKDLLVHPAETYLGLKADRWFVPSGESITVDVVAATIEGKPVAGKKPTVRAERLDWSWEKGEWREEIEETETCEVETKEKPVECSFDLKKGGTWRITGIIEDEEGRRNLTQFRVWVAGGDQPSSKRLEREDLRLVPEKTEWAPGESAKILVQAPFPDGHGLAMIRHNGIEQEIAFSMEGSTHTLDVPIREEQIPNIGVQVEVVGATERLDEQGEPLEDAPKRPAFASGELDLGISAKSKVLDVEVTPESTEVAPGGETQIGVEVVDENGQPAAKSQVALVVVDEAILAAADYELGKPVLSFFPKMRANVRSYRTRASVVLASLEQIRDELGRAEAGRKAAEAARPDVYRSVAEEAKATGAEAITLRKDLRPLALFAPALETDAEGRASVSFELPDNLTRYRVMAVAVQGSEKSGRGESQISARLPLMVQPSMPRFLNSGDHPKLPVVVHNQTGEKRTVQLAARARNLELTGTLGRRFEVEAGDRVELQFPARTESPGTARLQFAAASGDWTDAAEVDLPVWTPATTQAFATYGTLDQGAVSQSVAVPEDALEDFGELQVTTSSTALEQLTDAFLYLVDYPYGCSEQIASRLLSVAALRDVLAAFDAEGLPSEEELLEAVRDDVEKLVSLQTEEGGFTLWNRKGRAWPYVSVHATHALAVARAKGFDVPESAMEKARTYLRDIEKHVPDDWNPKARNAVWAYALYVLQKIGSPEPGETAKLAGEKLGKALSLEAAGWLMSALSEMPSGAKTAQKLRKAIGNRAIEEAGTAHFADAYEQGEHLLMHSNRRADAVLLEAMIRQEPQSSLIPKVVRGLMAHRTKGRWSNTQENVFVLLALDRYFQTFEKKAPDFVADLWLGGKYVGRHAYRERTGDRTRVDIPLSAVREVATDGGDPTADLLVSHEGEGRLYYRIGMRYAPESYDLEPLEQGFAVERTYEAVDDESEVRQREDGTWVIEAGSRVRVQVRMVVPTRRYHVALVDPLAAGFEILNPSIATTEPIPEENGDGGSRGGLWWWHRPWFEHQNLRDERAEAFASIVWAGVHRYSYVVRATTPGEFIVPPVRAEEMYQPETRGHGATDRVVVK